MSHVAHFRHVAAARVGPGVLVALLFGALCGVVPAVSPPDPVEDLRQALPIQLGEERNQNALDYRRKTLAKSVEALRTIGEMRRALVLTEWKDAAGRDSPGPLKQLADIDQKARTRIGENFMKAVEAVVQRGDDTGRLAVATLLGEMGANVRSLDSQDLAGFGRSLAPLLIRLTGDRDQEVRAAAARSLGKVNPVPKKALPPLKGLLEKGTAEDRRAAAEGLVSLVEVVAQLQKKGRAQTGVEASRLDVINSAQEVIGVSGVMLKDPDVRVRRLGIDALLQAATGFRELVPEPFPVTAFPPPDRKLTLEEEKAIRSAQRFVKQELESFEPLIRGAKAQARALARALSDPDPMVREKARVILEMYGTARLRLNRLLHSVPRTVAVTARLTVQAIQKEGEAKQDDLSLAIAPGLEVVTRGVRDPSVRVRRSTLDFLESLEEAAAPAIPAIVGALRDPDRFVRWAAARTLGKIGPIRTGLTVPALAGLLQDEDLDVSLVAAATLKSFGSDARAAVPALIAASAVGDAESRVAAIQTLASIGVSEGAPSVPALIEALANSDARVRKAAAETLGGFGPTARGALTALRAHLQDEDQEVRRAASDALLSIRPPGK